MKNLSPKQKEEIRERILQIQGKRLSSKRGRMSYRDLTKDESDEIAFFSEKLNPRFSPEEMDLFSEVLQREGITVLPVLTFEEWKATIDGRVYECA